MKARFLTFFAVSVIILLFSAANFYVFSRLNTWLALGCGNKFNLVGALLGFFSFVIIIFHLSPARFVYYASAYWFGLMFLGINVFFVGDIATRIFPVNHLYMAYTAIFIVLLLAVYSTANHLSGRTVINVELLSTKIKTPLRIVLIADTHINRYYRTEYMQRLVREINNQKPDIVAIAGDFADGKTDLSTVKPVDRINAPVCLVMGNHEVWHNHGGSVEKIYDKSKIIALDREIYTHKGIRITGVHFDDGRQILKDGLDDIEIDRDKYNVLLYHEPKDFDIARDAGIDLMLCGHAHGGQIFPWNYATRLAYKYIKGLHDHKGMKVYVSQGTGVWGPPMRLGSKNEITVIDLKPDNKQRTKP